MYRNNKGIFGPWELHRKIGLGLGVLLCFSFVVILSFPLGLAALLSFILAVKIWLPYPGRVEENAVYMPLAPTRVAMFFTAAQMTFPLYLTPHYLGFGPPARDDSHGLEPGFRPFTRLSSYWALAGALVLGSSEFLLANVSVRVSLPWFITIIPSVVGFYALINSVIGIKRIQGDRETLMGITPKPAVMLSVAKVELDIRDMVKRSLMYGSIIAVVLLFTLFAFSYSFFLFLGLVVLGYVATTLIYVSKRIEKGYISSWLAEKERAEEWVSFLSVYKNPPTYCGEYDFPNYEEWVANQEDPENPEGDYEVDFTVVTFSLPPGVTVSEYIGTEDMIKGALEAKELVYFPVGEMNELGAEKPGTVNSNYFRLAYTRKEFGPISSGRYTGELANFLFRARYILPMSKIRGIGPLLLLSCSPGTTKESKTYLSRLLVKPVDNAVTVESFLRNVIEIQKVTHEDWARFQPDVQKKDRIRIHIGERPTSETIFINPASVERKNIAKADWLYFFRTQGLEGIDGYPTVLRHNKGNSEGVSRTVFRLPDGLDLGAVRASIEPLKSVSGNEFIEVLAGDEEFQKLSERERIRHGSEAGAKFTMSYAARNPLNSVFKFEDYTSRVLFPREAGKARVEWSPGVHADGELAWDSWDSADAPHLLVAGMSGSGKSVVMSSLILQIAHNNGPREAQFWMIEPKNEMQVYRDLDVVTRFVDSWTPTSDLIRNALELMTDAVAEMERRNKAMTSHAKQPKNIRKARDIAYNESLANGTPIESHPLYFPYIFVIVEECASLFADAADSEEKQLQTALMVQTAELARKARSAGIHLIFATQYPTNASIPSVIRNQCRRIGMRCQNALASRVVLEENGLELLRIRGTGKIRRGDDLSEFRGFWVQDGDPDLGEPNDIFGTLAKLPSSGLKKNASPTSASERVIVGAPDDGVLHAYDGVRNQSFFAKKESALAAGVGADVEAGKKTRDVKDKDIDRVIEAMSGFTL